MNKTQEQKSSALEAHKYLNDIDSELEEISLNFSIESSKQESFNTCKICYCEQTLNINEKLCQNCNVINKSNKISRISFITGASIGSIVSGVALGLSGAVCISAGLALGVVVQNIYKLF